MTLEFSLSASTTLTHIFQYQLKIVLYVDTFIFYNLFVSFCIIRQQRKFTIQFLIVTPNPFILHLFDVILFLPIFRLFLFGKLNIRMLQGLFTPVLQRAVPFAKLSSWSTTS
jgi:hypothetical protein